MQIRIEEPDKPLTEQDILRFERDHSIAIPSAYRSFLLQFNGGHPEPDVFFYFARFHGNVVPNGPLELGSSVAWFQSIGSEYENLGDALNWYKDRLPDGFFPFARDPGDNLICLATVGPYSGQVFYWDHEDEADPDQGEVPTMRNVYFVADSFQAFLEGLYELDPAVG